MKNLTITELLTKIELREQDSENASRAFDEFCRRYNKRLVTICIVICKHYRLAEFEEVAKDVCQETLIKVFLHASQFKRQDYQNATSVQDGLFKWMSKIAANELRLSLRKKMGVLINEEYWLNVEEEQIEISIDPKKQIKLELIEKAINDLGARDSDIARTALLSHPKYLDRHELNKLSKTYGIAKATVRQIKKRSIEKIKLQVLDMYQHL